MFRRCNKDFRDVVRKMGDVVLTPNIVIAGAGVDGSAVLQGAGLHRAPDANPSMKRTGGGRKSTQERQEVRMERMERMERNVNAERQSINDGGLARAFQNDDAQRQPVQEEVEAVQGEQESSEVK